MGYSKRDNSQMLSVSEVAEMLGINPEVLMRWRRAGKGPPFFDLGHKAVRYPREELENLAGEALPRGRQLALLDAHLHLFAGACLVLYAAAEAFGELSLALRRPSLRLLGRSLVGLLAHAQVLRGKGGVSVRLEQYAQLDPVRVGKLLHVAGRCLQHRGAYLCVDAGVDRLYCLHRLVRQRPVL